MEKVYWYTQNGQKISVDDMDINHLRNTLKMVIRNRQQLSPQATQKPSPFMLNFIDHQIDEMFADADEDETFYKQ